MVGLFPCGTEGHQKLGARTPALFVACLDQVERGHQRPHFMVCTTLDPTQTRDVEEHVRIRAGLEVVVLHDFLEVLGAHVGFDLIRFDDVEPVCGCRANPTGEEPWIFPEAREE